MNCVHVHVHVPCTCTCMYVHAFAGFALLLARAYVLQLAAARRRAGRAARSPQRRRDGARHAAAAREHAEAAGRPASVGTSRPSARPPAGPPVANHLVCEYKHSSRLVLYQNAVDTHFITNTTHMYMYISMTVQCHCEQCVVLQSSAYAGAWLHYGI